MAARAHHKRLRVAEGGAKMRLKAPDLVIDSACRVAAGTCSGSVSCAQWVDKAAKSHHRVLSVASRLCTDYVCIAPIVPHETAPLDAGRVATIPNATSSLFGIVR